MVSPLAAQAPPPPTQPPVTKPSPSPTPTPSAQPAARAQATGPFDGASVDPRLTGVSIYTGATYLQSFDLDKNQTMFVFGTNDAYTAVVGFYKSKYRGQEVSKTPAIQQFDLGNFDSNTMTQRPSVLVKDYTWPDAAGYLHVSGTKQVRYLTLIQIIPVGR